ncbi:MAG: hypothetical protein LUF02_03805 [Erysipelotrichaceae bacterium]|nr:hypothetical protein [Erysipelotrichaceae bacterium]
MMLVNYVYDDEELLEPYEWEDSDTYQFYQYLPIYRVSTQQLHDFIYAKMKLVYYDNDTFIVSDGHYSVVIELKEDRIYRRGTLDFKQENKIQRIVQSLNVTYFSYYVVAEAYEKEFGLTREERLKKQCVEEVIDELFLTHDKLFEKICHEWSIHEEDAQDNYLTLKKRLEKGYSSLHDILYDELVYKK